VAPPHYQQTGEIIPLRPDHRFDIDASFAEHLQRETPQPTRGERLVDFFRFNGEFIVGMLVGIAIGGLLTTALAYTIRAVLL
jgi:F0F1-type ATP synthase assembly protein I